MKFSIAFFLICLNAAAIIRPNPGHHSVYALLKLKSGNEATLYINPGRRERYYLRVHNPSQVAEWIKQKEFIGQVKVDVEVFNPHGDQADSKVTKIEVVHMDKLPLYDGNFE